MDQSKRFDLPSGASVSVTMSEYRHASALKNAALKTLKGTQLSKGDLDFDFKKGMTAKDVLSKSPGILTKLLDRIIDFSTSQEVEDAFWLCAQRALYIPPGSPEGFGIKVDRSLMDHVELAEKAREDLPAMVRAIAEVNCLPFFKSALSGFLKEKDPNPEGRNSESN